MTARLLLDSNVFLWWSGRRSELSANVVGTISAADEAFLSIVTPWELELKKATGKLTFPADLWDELPKRGLSLLRSSCRTRSPRRASRCTTGTHSIA